MAFPAGRPCHVDLMSTDLAASTAFYGAVLGWSYTAMGPAFSARVDDRQAAAVVPPFDGECTGWTLYFSTDDIATTEAAIIDAGGTLVLPHGDVGEMGKLLLADDPTGARFGAWQAGQKVGSEGYAEPGFLTWTDLRSTDPSAANAFYGSAFGHVYTPLAEAGEEYETYSCDGSDPLGGVGGMMGSQAVSSHWLPYFAVADIHAAIGAARPAGTVLAEPFPTPFGTMSALQDPHGNPFWVVQLPA